MDKATAQACEYAGLISDICKLSARGVFPFDRDLEARVFERLGFETCPDNGGNFWIRRNEDESWHRMPQILTDFGTAIQYTIGSRHGTLDHPLEKNWYIKEMCETAEETSMDMRMSKIAAWALRLGRINSRDAEATAVTPAAALVAAWLRAHP